MRMSRLKRLRNINGLIEILQTIIKNQCSLSEIELNLLNEAIAKLNRFKSIIVKTKKNYEIEILSLHDVLPIYHQESSI